MLPRPAYTRRLPALQQDRSRRISEPGASAGWAGEAKTKLPLQGQYRLRPARTPAPGALARPERARLRRSWPRRSHRLHRRSPARHRSGCRRPTSRYRVAARVPLGVAQPPDFNYGPIRPRAASCASGRSYRMSSAHNWAQASYD